MTAGLILTGKIWVFTFTDDDEVGGAQPSGSVIYEGVQVRIENAKNSLALNIQGFETSKYFSAILYPRPDMVLSERKHFLQITSPPNSRHYLDMFRIINIQESNFHPSDPRRYLYLNLERSELGHGNNYQ